MPSVTHFTFCRATRKGDRFCKEQSFLLEIRPRGRSLRTLHFLCGLTQERIPIPLGTKPIYKIRGTVGTAELKHQREHGVHIPIIKKKGTSVGPSAGRGRGFSCDRRGSSFSYVPAPPLSADRDNEDDEEDESGSSDDSDGDDDLPLVVMISRFVKYNFAGGVEGMEIDGDLAEPSSAVVSAVVINVDEEEGEEKEEAEEPLQRHRGVQPVRSMPVSISRLDVRTVRDSFLPTVIPAWTAFHLLQQYASCTPPSQSAAIEETHRRYSLLRFASTANLSSPESSQRRRLSSFSTEIPMFSSQPLMPSCDFNRANGLCFCGRNCCVS